MSKARQWTDDYDQRDTLPKGHEEVERLRVENEKLRAVAEAARTVIDLDTDGSNAGMSYLIKALEALDE